MSKLPRGYAPCSLLLLALYVALATLFAVTTPAWQNPDEPAHYNYIAHLAQGKGLPVLQPGDYDQAYLEQLKREKFPPQLSVEPVRYEFHQPPLYYLLATPVFWLTGGSLLALRLFSALLGGGVTLLVAAIARTLFPHRPWIALGAMAFTALLPMHLAILSAVNNDSLAELLIAGTVLALLGWLKGALERGSQGASPKQLVAVSVLLGLALLTKATAYILLPIAVLVVAGVTWQARREEGLWGELLRHLLAVTGPALLLGLPLWIRNWRVYGPGDILGLRWHDRVVTGQPLTSEWIAAHGWAAYSLRALRFTFDSFWGVFGWLGVFMDSRIYTALLVFSLILAMGLAAWLLGLGRGERRLSRFQGWGLATLTLLLLAAVASYAWYNLRFVQHQGRYLFPALPAIALFAALAWQEALRPRTALLVGGFLLSMALGALLYGVLLGPLDKWLVLFLGLGGGGLLAVAGAGMAEERQPGAFGTALATFRLLAWASPAMLFALLDAAAPFVYIMPQLSR